MSGSKRTLAALPSEICAEVFARLPAVEDKVRLASVCQAFRKASKDPRSWKDCSIVPSSETPQTEVGMIWALCKHAQHLENLVCSSKGADMMLRLNAAWLYLPKLKRLGLSMPLDTLDRMKSKITLPSSLQALDLKVFHRGTREASLESLQSFSPALKSLMLDATDFVSYVSHGHGYGHHQQRLSPQLQFNSKDLPSMRSICLKGPHTFHGQLLASCLTHVKIQNNRVISWKLFDQCRRLSNIHLTSLGIIDFTHSEPLSLASVQNFRLEAGALHEDGAFQGLDASQLDLLTLKVNTSVAGHSWFKLDHLHADANLMWRLEATKDYTTCSISRRSCKALLAASAQHA